jgi:protein-L-isoaspartate(D-aspartate) O-methyltransferase
MAAPRHSRHEHFARRAARHHLVREVDAEVRQILVGRRAGLSRRVLRAMLRVPREAFLPVFEADLAYVNHALPIGHGQTISQPLIVALMTHLLDVGPRDTVLEIGTGSGYQAAVLAEVVGQVCTVEVIPALAEAASKRLRALGYRNVAVRIGDGNDGWSEHAPYDGVIVTAAAPRVPAMLLAQLRVGRRLVMPLGDEMEVQWLAVVQQQPDGSMTTQRVLPVRFVPFTGRTREH